MNQSKPKSLDDLVPRAPSPYLHFEVARWAKLRDETSVTLTGRELAELASLNDRISPEEVEAVYLPLCRLIAIHVAASRALFQAREREFLGDSHSKTVFIVGIAGSVAAGKSTTARVLRALLSRWPTTPTVEIVTTDGFLFPNAVLSAKGLMERKGFPESYDVPALLAFLSDVKAGREIVEVPVYSHLAYDVVASGAQEVRQPDILIVEGLNVLQTRELPREGVEIPFVSDFFDFSVYIDADERDLERWYVERFMTLRDTRFRDPASYFNKYAGIDDREAVAIARELWRGINLVNLHENILATRSRASLVLLKGPDHGITDIALRRL